MTDNIEKIKVGDTSHDVGLRNIYINSKGNFNIETSTELGNTKKGKINIESMNDIQFKSGDDIIFYSHHRAAGKNDEVAVKVTNGDDIPVKLQVNAANLTLTTKDKDLTQVYADPADATTVASDKSEDEVLDVTISTGKDAANGDNERGYLKVRARAIDLRCEEHGGVAIQPNGTDSDGNENKVKFEHGGGDGLEFLTMNTDKTSIFTNEYRFNKNGIVKAATRDKKVSKKYKEDNETTHYNYKKQADDFYDKIDAADPTATWGDIITVGSKLADLQKLIDYAKEQGWIS